MNNAKVELMDVALKGCVYASFFIPSSNSETTVVATRCEFANSVHGAVVSGSLTSATFKNCVFHDNEMDGIIGYTSATVHLHGEATAIYSNGRHGIWALAGKVLIHLPSHHNTSYNNKGGDRNTFNGATITNVD